MTAHRRASGAASGVADAPAQGHALLLSCSFGANSNGVSVSCGYDGNDRVTGIGYTRGVETLKSIDLDYDGNGNVVRKNDSSYGYDERDMLLEADMHDRFAADIRESQTAGIATRDVSGQGELVCPEVESTFELDVNANSVGVDLGRNREVYGIVVTPAGVGNRLAKDNLEVWLRGSGQATWDELSRDDYVVEKDAQGGMDIRFRVPLAARYAKLHQLFDERNVEDQDVGVPTVTNVASVLLKLRYFVADRVESYSYDAAGKRQSLGVTFDGQARPGVSYSYYAGSELLKSDGRWGYRYDGNGNLVEKGCHLSHWVGGERGGSRRLVETKREALHVVRTDKENGDRGGRAISVAECPRAGQAVWYSLYRSISVFSVELGRAIPGSGLGGVGGAGDFDSGATATWSATSTGNPISCG